jgi:hypothetical protein
MTLSDAWVRKPLIVSATHEDKNRYQARRFLARPAVFPNGEPGVAIYNSGRIIAVFPEYDAQTLIFHMARALDRVGGNWQRPENTTASEGDS